MDLQCFCYLGFPCGGKLVGAHTYQLLLYTQNKINRIIEIKDQEAI
jgi:hypothetical protein